MEDVSIFYYNTDRPLLASELRKISKIRHEKAAAYKFSNDSLRCLAAGFLIAEYIGIDEREFIYNEYKKPYLPGNALFFNITHSKNLVALALSERELGIDIEPLDRQGGGIIGRVFTKDEIEKINNGCNFSRLWTAKEAVMKACGRGLALDPRTFNVLENIACADDRHWLIEISERDGYAISVAKEVFINNIDCSSKKTLQMPKFSI